MKQPGDKKHDDEDQDDDVEVDVLLNLSGEARIERFLESWREYDKDPEYRDWFSVFLPHIQLVPSSTTQSPPTASSTSASSPARSASLPLLPPAPNTTSASASASASANADTDSTVTFRYTPQHEHCSRLGTLHGGATATLFDGLTTMALYKINRPGFWWHLGVSRTLNVTYMRPIHEGEPVLLSARVVHAGGRMCTLYGVIRRERDGAVMATCEHGKFTIEPEDSTKL